MKPIGEWLDEKSVTLEELIESSGLEKKLVAAIVSGQYTPSPSQRQSLASALDLTVDDIAWGHTVPVQHLYGHGPQFGRTP